VKFLVLLLTKELFLYPSRVETCVGYSIFGEHPGFADSPNPSRYSRRPKLACAIGFLRTVVRGLLALYGSKVTQTWRSESIFAAVLRRKRGRGLVLARGKALRTGVGSGDSVIVEAFCSAHDRGTLL
jgi:hypothetical protein